MSSPSVGFKRIYYDYRNQKMYHWFIGEDGKTYKEIAPIEYEYYVYDTTNKSEIKDIYGKSVVPQKSKDYFAMKNFKTSGIKTCEMNISQEIKFLHKRYGKQTLIPDISKFQIADVDIECESEFEFPKPDEVKFPINLISVWLSKTNEVTTFGLRPYTGDSPQVKNYHYCADEKTLIEKFILFCNRSRIDIMTGWFINGFDIPYIINRCEVLGITMSLSPLGTHRKKSSNAGYKTDGGGFEIAGINVLDYLDLYKNFTREKKQTYNLNSICLEEINQGKIVFDGKLNDLWKRDWNLFVEYNVQDVLLVKELDKNLKFIELVISMCYDSLIPFEKVVSAVNLSTGMILKFCHKENVVIPDTKRQSHEKFDGAYVYAVEGMHKYCMNFDVQSMYPHLMMQFNISPETLVKNHTDTKDLISTPLEGIFYKKEKGVIPKISEHIFKSRIDMLYKKDICFHTSNLLLDDEIAKKINIPLSNVIKYKKEIEEEHGNSDYYERQQYILKIYVNSLFGVLGNPFFFLYNIDNARTITLTGQNLIKHLSHSINNYIRSNWNNICKESIPEYIKTHNIKSLTKDILILIDTDSGHFTFNEMIESIGLTFNNDKEFIDFCYILNERIFKPFLDNALIEYANKYNTEQRINFQREKISTKKLILAKKKYVDEVVEKKGKIYKERKLAITGIEAVRTDTPRFCRTKIMDVIELIFKTESKEQVLELIRDINSDFYKTCANDIASPTGISDYKKYSKPMEYYLQNGLRHEGKQPPIHSRAAINYNYIVSKYKLPYILIDDKTKMKYCYIYDNNLIHQNVIGFIGEWPEKFNELFKINYDEQWRVGFQDTIDRFFKVLGWDQVNLEKYDWSEF